MKTDWQECGGSITIPEGWFVIQVDLDAEEPYCEIVPVFKEGVTNQDKKKLLIPKPLAYFLSKHWCGSQKMHDLIEANQRRKIRNGIRDLLGKDGD